MFRFGDPYYFLLLLPAAIAAGRVFGRRVSSALVFSAVPNIPAQVRTWRPIAVLVFSTMFVSGVVLAIVALARPQTVLAVSRRTADVIAIQMVLDVSGSMQALDMSDFAGNMIVKERTRLDAVKETFAEFVSKRPDDLIGLVTFAGYASTRVPLTSDHEALLHVLKGIDVPRPVLDASGQIINQEEMLTAIGDGLATACARLEKAEPKSKIVVLLSDGESNTGIIKPETAAEIARKMGIKVYTIGVGIPGEAEAPFKTRDVFGRTVIGRARVSLDESLLRKIAETTGGRYFHARDPKGLQRALEDISRLEKTRVEQMTYRHFNELFGWFLYPALVLLIIGGSGNMLMAGRIV